MNVVFSWYDYTLFAAMLGISVGIGIYFGFFGTKQSTVGEYFLGEKKMKLLPIVFSVACSHLSGVAILALPADVYLFGASLLWACLFTALLCPIASLVFLPIFYNLEISTVYEYLEKRFDYKVRILASSLFGLSTIVYFPITIYTPALAFEAVTDINAHIVVPVLCALCIFYTSIGGIKAVVWTDTIQFLLVAISMVTVLIMSVAKAGGFEYVWKKSAEGQRLDIFNFDFDPTKRDTFWIIVLGHAFGTICSVCTNPACVQKYLALSTLKKAKVSMCVVGFEIAAFGMIIVFMGLVMYAYFDCDPILSAQIRNSDQLLPYFISDVTKNLPGLSGLFIAGIFCASLSTLSAGLNSLAGTIYNDFVLRRLPKSEINAYSSFVLKIIVALLGIFSAGMVYVVENLGNLWPLVQSLGSITSGPLMGLFILGALNPLADSKGTLLGGIASLIFMVWIVTGNQYYSSKGIITYAKKPVSTNACLVYLNQTHIADELVNNEVQLPFFLYRISFYYFTLIGTLFTVIVGSSISLFTRRKHQKVAKDVLHPMVHGWQKIIK